MGLCLVRGPGPCTAPAASGALPMGSHADAARRLLRSEVEYSTRCTVCNFRLDAGLPPSYKSIPRSRKVCLAFQGSGEMQQRRILKPVGAVLDAVSKDGDLIEIALTHSGLSHRLQVENLL